MDFFADHPGRIFVVAATLPLVSALLLYVIGIALKLRNRDASIGLIAGWFAVMTMAVSAACSLIGSAWLFNDIKQFEGMPSTISSRWSESSELLRIGSAPGVFDPSTAIQFGYTIDRLSLLMITMVTIVGTLIFLFSLGYMKEELKGVHDHEAHVARRGRFATFFLYLLLFAFSMLQILIADNLLQIFVGWELVGVSSFLLIGFYTERRTATNAANKAFIMNRIGDAGFLVALAIAFNLYGTFSLDVLTMRNFGDNFNRDSWLTPDALWTIMGLGLFAGCVGKSAQVPLQTWLPDAMEGPTPVSALIHAATMVAAGVYLCARCLPMFHLDVLNVIAWTGAITMLLSALTACVQTDIKRVLAFSTCSQLGLMMLALGLGGWSAGLFHLLTHAFFKALLFLAAGSVIYGLHHEQNLMKMGGVFRRMPITAVTMLVGVLAIIGVPLFSGWYSKDAVLTVVYGHFDKQPVLAVMAFLTAILTAYYMVRLWLMAFAGESRGDHHEVHESPMVMTIPLLILAAFSIGVAWGWPVWDAHSSELLHVLEEEEPKRLFNYGAGHDNTAGIVAGACMLVGVTIAIIRYRSGAFLKPQANPISKLLENRFYFDAIYNALFTRTTLATSRSLGAFDKRDPSVSGGNDASLDSAFTGAGVAMSHIGSRLAPLQSGRLRGYILALGLTVTGGLAILWVLR